MVTEQDLIAYAERFGKVFRTLAQLIEEYGVAEWADDAIIGTVMDGTEDGTFPGCLLVLEQDNTCKVVSRWANPDANILEDEYRTATKEEVVRAIAMGEELTPE
jgi:hypothetical protein